MTCKARKKLKINRKNPLTLGTQKSIMNDMKGTINTMQTTLSKIKNEFFSIGTDPRLWFKSQYVQDDRAWRVCLVQDPFKYKLLTSKTEVKI
jgi:hypothetical protein